MTDADILRFGIRIGRYGKLEEETARRRLLEDDVKRQKVRDENAQAAKRYLDLISYHTHVLLYVCLWFCMIGEI